jgi:hypothetical protein
MSTAAIPPPVWAAMNTGAEDGAIPANVFDSIRPMVIAGLAKLVEAVNQYVAPIQAPAAAGTLAARPDRVSAKMTRISPAVAMTSDSACAPDARCFTETDTADSPNIRFAATAPVTQPATWAGR